MTGDAAPQLPGPPRRIRWIHAAGLWVALCLAAAPVHAGDYDRNDIAGRGVGLVAGALPIQGAPLMIGAQASARKHMRWLVLGTELIVGGHSEGHFTGIVSGFAGAETSTNAFTRIRGYGELGASMMYAGSRLGDTLLFYAEGGLRIKLRSFARPHLSFQIGWRAMLNFNAFGWMLPVGVQWAFD